MNETAKKWIDDYLQINPSEIDLKKIMYECQTGELKDRGQKCDEWYLFDSLASRAGHNSGYSAARDYDLWDFTIEDAINEIVPRA